MSVFYEIISESTSRIKKYPWWCDLHGPFELSDGSRGVGPFTLIRYTSNETPGTFNLRCLHSMRKRAYNKLPKKCDAFAVVRQDGTLVRRRYLHNHPPMSKNPTALNTQSVKWTQDKPTFDDVVALLTKDGRGRKKKYSSDLVEIDFDNSNLDSEETEEVSTFAYDETEPESDLINSKAEDENTRNVFTDQYIKAGCSCPFDFCGRYLANPQAAAAHCKTVHLTRSRAKPLFKIKTKLISRGVNTKDKFCPQCLKRQEDLESFRDHLRNDHRVHLCV